MSRTLFRTRIKFCGLTRSGDVRLASELGADAIGFVFTDKSPRRVQPEEARAMRNALAPLVDAVALFMDSPVDEVREVIRQVRPSLLQFHGSEDDAYCRSFGLPYLKAFSMGGSDLVPDARMLHSRYPSASGFLFDGHAAGETGGSGRGFDWSRIPEGLTKPCVVAGGLRPDNVFDAIMATLPWGVDVSSGIEVRPGIKNAAAMRAFVAAVRRADSCSADLPGWI